MRQPMILNVDDDEAGRYAVTRVLQHSNFQVKEAATGAEALKIARTELPDLVLLDVNLPDISGFEVCRILKTEAATSAIPILHITASYRSGQDVVKGLESGADSYLVEPVEPEVLVATVRSVLRARNAEESARALARQWQSTFEAIRDGVAVLDANGRIERCNSSLARILGRDASELPGKILHEFWETIPVGERPFMRAMESRCREHLELERDGKELTVTVDPMFDDAGNPAGAVEIVSDVTEKRRLEEQFRESQKFETIGTLAAGVAHDFNNLLTSIMGNASLLLAETDRTSQTAEKLNDVLRASQRAADLTRQLLAYSGKGRHYPQKVEISGLIREMQDLIEAAVPKKVDLRLELPSGLPRIEADPKQFQQVLLNLVSNAAEAIGEEAGDIIIRTGADADGSVFLEVHDTGCGMSAETQARMFDPFFTTKFTGRGLGLSAVSGIVRGHKGSIQVTSAPNEGSTFHVAFPAAEAPAVVVEAPRAAGEAGTVLVVDDEEMVRRIAKTALENRGYPVLQAKDGLEAIRQARKHPEIKLVLLDLTMPVMGGAEAIGDILAAHPGVKVIVSTGYDHHDAEARFQHEQVAGFLQKPYTARQLIDKVETVLSAGVQRPA